MQNYRECYGQPGQVQPWQAALYIRLSKEDLDNHEGESQSIAHQREIIDEYCKAKG